MKKAQVPSGSFRCTSMDAELAAAPEITLPEDAPAPEFVPPCDSVAVKLYDRLWTQLLR